MKVQIYNWAGSKGASTLIEKLGYRHKGYYDVENVYSFVEMLHFAGLNVMLPQPHDGVQLVAVDLNHLFTQR